MRYPWPSIIAASFALLAASCLSKGDTNLQGTPTGETPTCANICGLVTSSNPNWDGYGKYTPKDDRQLCIDQCTQVAPTDDELVCGAKAADCAELDKCGSFW